MANIGNKIVELNGKGKFVGYRFFLNGQLYTERKCRICGKWFQYKGNKEPAHCGNSACEEWWKQALEHQMKKTQVMNGGEKEFFGRTDVVKTILNNAKNINIAQRLMAARGIVPDQFKPKSDRRKFVFAVKGG